MGTLFGTEKDVRVRSIRLHLGSQPGWCGGRFRYEKGRRRRLRIVSSSERKGELLGSERMKSIIGRCNKVGKLNGGANSKGE